MELYRYGSTSISIGSFAMIRSWWRSSITSCAIPGSDSRTSAITGELGRSSRDSSFDWWRERRRSHINRQAGTLALLTDARAPRAPFRSGCCSPRWELHRWLGRIDWRSGHGIARSYTRVAKRYHADGAEPLGQRHRRHGSAGAAPGSLSKRSGHRRAASLVQAHFFQQRDEARIGAKRVEHPIDPEKDQPLRAGLVSLLQSVQGPLFVAETEID